MPRYSRVLSRGNYIRYPLDRISAGIVLDSVRENYARYNILAIAVDQSPRTSPALRDHHFGCIALEGWFFFLFFILRRNNKRQSTPFSGGTVLNSNESVKLSSGEQQGTLMFPCMRRCRNSRTFEESFEDNLRENLRLRDSTCRPCSRGGLPRTFTREETGKRSLKFNKSDTRRPPFYLLCSRINTCLASKENRVGRLRRRADSTVAVGTRALNVDETLTRSTRCFRW